MTANTEGKNDIVELRNLMFSTIRDLRAGAIDIDKAKAINETAQVIVNSAKVEVDHMKVAGGNGSGFIGAASSPNPKQITQTPTGTKTVIQDGSGTTTRHSMRG